MDNFRIEIRNKVDKITEDINELKLQVGRIASHVESEQGTLERAFKRIHNDLETLDHSVHGNGSDGMKTEVAILKDRMTRLTKLIWWVATVLGTAIAANYGVDKFIGV